ncbi:MAG: response regulator [Bryobacteraceae bacterium]|nr:response regulator [Bryobacteraceae bacterium]
MLNVLLVEDNRGDARLIREGMRISGDDVRLDVVEDGDDAIEFLRGGGRFGRVPRPHLVILDLNLPKRDGREVLAVIKQDPALRKIPVIVLTTSGDASDIQNAYDLHANCYIRKPSDLDEYLQVINRLRQFWVTTARLPAV